MARRPRPNRVPPPARLTRRRAAVLTTLVGLVLVLFVSATATGCSKSTEAQGPTADDTALNTHPTKATSTPAPETPTSTSSSTATKPATVEEQVKAAYLDITAAYFRGMADPDPTDPEIQQNYSGNTLASVTDEVRRYRDARQIAVPASGVDPVPVIQSVTVTGDSAVVVACVVDDMQLLQLPDRSVVNGNIVSKLYRPVLVRRSGRWVMDSREHLKSWPDALGCDR